MHMKPVFDERVPADERVVVENRVEEPAECLHDQPGDDDAGREPSAELGFPIKSGDE